MSDQSIDLEKRLLAAAIFELRVLLSAHIDQSDQSPEASAALFAYALHNQALSTLQGRAFNVDHALDAIAKLEPRLGSEYISQFRRVVLNEA